MSKYDELSIEKKTQLREFAEQIITIVILSRAESRKK
jgi:hypothetical protein